MSHIPNDIPNDIIWFTEPLRKSTLVDAHPRHHGFRNLSSSNVCYVNATVQCLLHCPMFVTALQDIFAQHEIVKHEKCAVCGLGDALYTLLAGNRKEPRLLRIAEWAPAIGEQFVRGRQHDANEFLTFLIDALQNVENFGCGATKHLPRELTGTLFGKVLCGAERSSKYCTTCKNILHGTEREFTGAIPLEIKEYRSIEEALQNKYGREDRREARCEICGGENNQTCYFRTTLVRAPNVLVFLLKNQLATTFNISLQPVLELDGNIIMGKRPSVKVRYELRAVQYRDETEGQSAHFTSAVKSRNGWWYMNDDVVAEQFEGVANGENAFLVYYERVITDGSIVSRFQEPGLTLFKMSSLDIGSDKIASEKADDDVSSALETLSTVSNPELIPTANINEPISVNEEPHKSAQRNKTISGLHENGKGTDIFSKIEEGTARLSGLRSDGKVASIVSGIDEDTGLRSDGKVASIVSGIDEDIANFPELRLSGIKSNDVSGNEDENDASNGSSSGFRIFIKLFFGCCMARKEKDD